MTLVAIEDPSREIRLTGNLLLKYQAIEMRLGPALSPIMARINTMIDSDRIHTSSWMPGANWTGTPFQAIYDVCSGNSDEAAKAFGLIVWKVFEEHPETWASAHGMKDGREIRGSTYFRWPDSDA